MKQFEVYIETKEETFTFEVEALNEGEAVEMAYAEASNNDLDVSDSITNVYEQGH